MVSYLDAHIEYLRKFYKLQIFVGKGLAVELDLNQVPSAQFAAIIHNGCKNQIGDSHVSVTQQVVRDKNPTFNDEQVVNEWRKLSLEIVNRKIAAIYDGTSRSVQTGSRASPATTVEREALKLAKAFVAKKTEQWEKGNGQAWAFISTTAKQLGMAEPKGKHTGEARNTWAKEVIDKAISVYAKTDKYMAKAKTIVDLANDLDPVDDEIAAIMGLATTEQAKA